jgi:uroporphyrinogen-III decarboxylase
MTRRERLLAVLQGRPTDRVPVLSGHFNEWVDDWKAREPSYHRLVAFCQEHCDGILSWRPKPTNETAPGTSSDRAQTTVTVQRNDDGGEETTVVYHTPAGPLTRRTRRMPEAATVWTVEHACKGPEDAETFLSLPREPVDFDGSSFAEAEARIGGAGLVLGETADPLCLAGDLFDSSTYCIVAATEPELFTRLLDYFHAGIMEHLDAMLSSGRVPWVRIYGPEYAVPPFLPPRLFDRYVVPYVTEMIERIHAAGAFARIHSHGCVREALPKFVAMGADATDPVEPPPDGDVTLAEAKRITDGRLTIFGNLELKHLETMSRQEVVDLTRRTLAEGMPGGRFALQPTAEPITVPLNPKLEENWMAYIETGLECGSY